jgi:hypothetical protein
VFYKSWSSNDTKLLAATVLLFILVITRSFQKSLALRSSSFNALRNDKSAKDGKVDIDFSQVQSVSKFVERAKYALREWLDLEGSPRGRARPTLSFQLFLDFRISYSDRINAIGEFGQLDKESAYRKIEAALSAMTNFLYTKDNTTPYLAFKGAPAELIFRRCIQILAYATLATVIWLVHTSSYKEAAYSGEDTRVTLVLLYGTLLLELVYFCVRSFLRGKFSGRIFQHNLFRYFLHNKRHSTLRIVAGWLQCNDLLDEFGHMDPSDKCEEITELVRRYLQKMWKEFIRDGPSYRMLNDSRGEVALRLCGCYQQPKLWCIERPFDESVIVWHLATDLCLAIDLWSHAYADTPPHGAQLARGSCKEMSNYMMHLLFDNPEMLLPGSRKGLFADVCKEIEFILKAVKTPLSEMELAMQIILERDQITYDREESLISPALQLAEHLLGLDETWECIQAVWVEMLLFSAGRCRGYLHAEALGTGLEYLSYVSLLMAYTGMEMFPEKLQTREG